MTRNSSRHLVVGILLLLVLECTTVKNSPAQESPVTSPQVSSYVEFDLSSTSPTMTAAAASSAEIKVAGTTLAVTAGTQLTPAQYVAYQQVMNSGSQTLVLGTQGQAVGGSFSFGTITMQPLSNVMVPGNVTAIHDAALAPSITLSGNLTNSGTIYALSTDAAVTTATFNATNIFNQPGALFTSILPTQGLAGFASAISGLNLSLSAVNDIVNNGVISSAGNLNLAAGGSIINQTVGNVAAITATQSLNLAASTLNNAGLISAITGNINIDAANIYNQSVIESIRGNIAISNTIAPELGIKIASDSGGIIRALLGEITSTTADTSLKYNTSISGGKILAGEILLTSGEGHLNLNVDDIHGGLRVRAGTASLSVSAGTNGLNIQELSITGDPDLIYSGAGPFVSPAFNSFGGLVNIDTSADTVNGSITFTGNIVTTPPPPGAGGSVTLKAGTTISTQAIITNSGGGGTAGGAIYLSGPQGVTVKTDPP